MGAGQEFVKSIKPVGCVLFLLISAYFLYVCFSSGKNPIPGYEAPHDSTYYSQSAETLSELKTELETNVFPHLDGITDCQIRVGKLEISLEKASYFKSRAAILRFYDESLFDFVEVDTSQQQRRRL